jgi:hypothetical protein
MENPVLRGVPLLVGAKLCDLLLLPLPNEKEGMGLT